MQQAEKIIEELNKLDAVKDILAMGGRFCKLTVFKDNHVDSKSNNNTGAVEGAREANSIQEGGHAVHR
jgi:hypothetical protein